MTLHSILNKDHIEIKMKKEKRKEKERNDYDKFFWHNFPRTRKLMKQYM
jgi:hypothetical protein